MSRRIARVRIAPELLCKALHFPPRTQIVGVRWEAGRVALSVQHPDLREVPDGQEAPLANPCFREQPPVAFVGWGQPETPRRGSDESVGNGRDVNEPKASARPSPSPVRGGQSSLSASPGDSGTASDHDIEAAGCR